MNLRVDAAALPAPGGQPTPVIANVSVASLAPTSVRNAAQTVGTIVRTLLFNRGGATPGPGAGQLIIPVFFEEASPSSFRLRGSGPNGESGEVTGLAGQADTAARLRLRMTNVPPGAQVFVSTSSQNNGAQLVSAGADGVGGSTVAGAPRADGAYSQLTVEGGAATATWEIVSSDINSIETQAVRLLFEGVSVPDLANVQLEGAMAPVSTVGAASSIAPIPRFLDPRQPLSLVNLRVTTRATMGSRPQGLRSPNAAPNITFTHTIANDASIPATNVLAQNNLPAGLTLVSCAASAGSCASSGDEVAATIPAIAPGTEATVTVVAQVLPSVPPGTVIENTVSAGGAESDSDLLNNRASTVVQGAAGGCAFTLARTSYSFGPSGDIGRIDVAAPPMCSWNVNSTVDWVAPESGTPITGSGTARFRVAPNTANAERHYSLDVAGQSVNIHQPAASCRFGVAASATNIPAAGGSFTLNVTAPAGCQWTAAAAPAWIAFGGAGPAGTGSGGVGFTVAANPLPAPRTGSIMVGGETVQVVQQRASTPPAAAAFSDIPLTHAYSDHITLLKQYGVTSGCSATAYCPDSVTTRGQMAVFIIRSILGGDNFNFPTAPYFTDVPAGHAYFKYIQKMRELGITSGCTATAYCPDSPVTRGQMGVFLMRGRMGLAPGTAFPFPATPYFADIPATHPYFGFLQKMREASITTGCNAANYCDGDPTTRGQMAVFLVRAFFTP